MRNLKSTLVLLIFVTIFASAQEYQITFSGSGASQKVDSIRITNLVNGTEKLIQGTDILHLDFSTGKPSGLTIERASLNIYPNPSAEKCLIRLSSMFSEEVALSIYSLSGKMIVDKTFYLESGTSVFGLSGLQQGTYVVTVVSESYSITDKLISVYESKGVPEIEFVENKQETSRIKRTKSTSEDIIMPYTSGERLKFVGYSDGYSSIMTDIPQESKAISFEFTACTDGDGDNYPTVKINNAVWMARNLSTTKYNDGSLIPKVTDQQEWMGMQTPAYCWYGNDSVINGREYGGLYNWFVVNTEKICPVGWHVPSLQDWEDVENYLNNTSVGSKLRETGSDHWGAGNTAATNEVGFTGLPGGFGYGIDGQFDKLGSSSGYCTNFSDSEGKFSMYLISNTSETMVIDVLKQDGVSIRCVKDE